MNVVLVWFGVDGEARYEEPKRRTPARVLQRGGAERVYERKKRFFTGFCIAVLVRVPIRNEVSCILKSMEGHAGQRAELSTLYAAT